MTIGYTPVELGNPDLKPNFVFYGDSADDFIELRKNIQTINSALASFSSAIERHS